jgi:hypothetical protein
MKFTLTSGNLCHSYESVANTSVTTAWVRQHKQQNRGNKQKSYSLRMDTKMSFVAERPLFG